MTVAVVHLLAVLDRVRTWQHAPGKLAVGDAETGIDHVHRDSGSVAKPDELAVERQLRLIDPIEAPRRVRLDRARVHRRVLHDQLDGRVLRQRFGLGVGHARREPAQCRVVALADRGAMIGGESIDRRREICAVDRGERRCAFQHHDVLVRHAGGRADELGAWCRVRGPCGGERECE